MVWALRLVETVNTHGFEDTAWQSVIFYFSSTEAMGTLTLQHSPTFPSPIKSQIKYLAMVIYPIPLCSAMRCLETPQILNSNHWVFLCFCLTDQKAFAHFLLCNTIHCPKTFAFINKIPCNNTLKVTGKKCWHSTGQQMWNTPVLLSRAFHAALCLMSPSPGLMTCQSFRNTLPSSSMIHMQS